MTGFRFSGAFLWVAIGVAIVACDDDSDALGERSSSETDARDAGSDATLGESGYCGNGRIDTFDDGWGHYGVEGCDDGNRQAGDGCSASCSVEDGFECNDERPQRCTQSTASLATDGAGGNAGSDGTPNAGGSGGVGPAGLGGEASMANGGGSGGQGGNGVGGQGMGATSDGGGGGDSAPVNGQAGEDGAGGVGGNGFNPIGTGGAGLGGSESQSGGAGGAAGHGGNGLQSGGTGGGGAAGGGGNGAQSGGNGAAGSSAGPEGCPNDDLYTLPMDQTLFIAAECNAFGVVGEWTCMDDGVRPSGCVEAAPIFREGEGVCLSGSITDDPTFAAWGAQLGATLAGSGGQSASFDASAQDIVGFTIAVTGSSGGAPLRISFESTNSGAVLPFIEVPGAGTYDFLFDDAIVPLSWMVPESGAKPDPSALVGINIQIVGGDQFANYDFCIESMRALGENVPEP